MYSTDNGAEVHELAVTAARRRSAARRTTELQGGCACRGEHPLAGRHQAWQHLERGVHHNRHAADSRGCRRRPGRVRNSEGFKVRATSLQGLTSTAYNLLPFLKGEVKENPRKGFLYWSDDGDLMALRVGNWKCTFMEQRAHGLACGRSRSCRMRVPTLYNLRSDPFERATEDASMFYDKWKADRAFLLVPAQAIVAEFLQTFKEFPAAAAAGELQHRSGARESTASASGDGNERRCGREIAFIAGRTTMAVGIVAVARDAHAGLHCGSGVRVLYRSPVSASGGESRSRA
jgi:hypothetical protein